MKRFNYKKKLTSVAFLLVLVFSQLALLAPRPAYAQWSVLNPDIILQNIQDKLSTSITDNIDKAWVSSIGSMLVNTMMATANYQSYQTVMMVATGGPAGSPLFSSLQTDEYMQYVGANVIFESYKGIDSADSVMTLFGARVPDDPEFLAIVRGGLKSSTSNELGEFDYRDVLGNWDSYLVSVYDSDDSTEVVSENILKTLAMSFDNNEYRSALDIYSQAIFEAEMQSQLAADKQLANAGFEDKVDPITGSILMPAAEVKKQFEDALESLQNLPTEIGLASLGDSSVLLQLGMYAGSIFTQTLGSELMEQLFSDGLVDSFSYDPFNPDARSGISRERAQDKYKSLLSFRPIQISDYDLLARLSGCPAQYLRNSPQLYSCALDTSFASAVARSDAGISLTIIDAIEEGYIDADWPLIPSSDTARNQDSNCYTYGFCHSNLVKLRKARVISIGWELAAEAQENIASSPVTLGEVVNAFNDCDENGERSSEYPWCHLIDPNWVLKYPAAQCRTLAYGQLLTASGATDRAEECVDIQSCISENEDGTCDGGYGYCVREKNVWEFRGDSCPEEYASCMSFVTTDGEAADYLTNTIDYGACDEQSIGCLWYATQKYTLADGTLNWPDVGNVSFSDQSTNAYKNRIYVNDNVEECSASEGGCEELLIRDEALSLNLVQNGSFEADTDNNDWPDAWLADDYQANMHYDIDRIDSRTGDSAVNSQGTSLYQYGAMLDQRQLYSFSFFAKQDASGGTSAVTSYVVLRDENGFEGVDLTYASMVGDCSSVGYDSLPGADAVRLRVQPDTNEYERFSCTFTTPNISNRTAQLSAQIIFEGSTIWIDDVQLEQNEETSIYHSDYNQSVRNIRSVVAKIPPDYLECTGSDADLEACASYAQICTENDRGCNEYTPVNGDLAITGIVNELDVCPSICVGYDTYKQEPTRYEPDGAFPLYFIPESGDVCTESAVGCDEFTNLSGESQEYFTYLRACVTEDQAAQNVSGDNAGVFYTWEGSDIEGFQLKSWQLLQSDLNNAPCTNWSANATGMSCDDANGEYAISAPDSCNEHADIFVNPDCREFYDDAGVIFYRPWSETVTVSNACSTYRKTDLVGATQLDQASNCTESGGYFDGVTSQCRYFGYSEESDLCSESENGCRKYTGGTSRNSRVAFEDVFETDSISAWDTTNGALVTYSNDSIATGGHSLNSDGATVWTYMHNNGLPCESATGCAVSSGTLGGECTVVDGKIFCGTLHNELYTGKTYTLTFWAKGSGAITPGFDIEANPGSVSLDVPFTDSGVALSNEWKRFSVGPLNMKESQYPTFGDGSVLAFVPANSGVIFNIDNVVLREGEQDITLIKDSWITPAQCDMNLQAQASPQFHLGCQEYADIAGNTAYLKSVSRLCSDDVVGCASYFKTAQSSSPNAQILNATCFNADIEGDPATGGADGTPDQASVKTSCYLETNLATGAFETSSTKLCEIIAGENSCFFDLDYFLPETLLQEPGFEHIFYNAETAYVEADRAVYAVIRDGDICADASAGCQEVGDSNLSADQSTVESWTSTWILNDPDVYSEILCNGDQLYCDAFSSATEGVWYFKDPQSRTCEYRTDVLVRSQSFDGWFRNDTDEFCYGTGTCSNTGDVCAEDSECRIGSCSVDGDTCYADFDCQGTQTCINDSVAECNITSGTYVIGGSLSGIWQNGDPNYSNWVGTCSADHDGCSEFRDVLDFDKDEFYGQTDGESYFFVDNSNLDDNTLLSSQKCNGLVSQELGCVLFHDTGEPGLDFNSSATYVASRHSDEIFGDKKFSLVKPITCDRGEAASTITALDGSSTDLCANRCVYRKSEMMSPIEYAEQTFANAGDEYMYGGSCFSNEDCSSYESTIGDLVSGECVSSVTADSDPTLADADVPRLSNDTNRVLKVDRDRECSEWLTCSSSQTVWDEDSSSYRTICNEIDLCTEYSNSGDSSFCSSWNPDDPAVILDSDRYSARDVTWYGEEYSGYAIPDLFPTQHLTQVNIAPPGTCESIITGTSIINGALLNRTGDVCVDNADCGLRGETCVPNIEKDYRLAFEAGTCSDSANFASACTIGYCSDSGSACSADTDCSGTGDCVTGVCLDAAGERTDTLCDINLACPGGAVCSVSVATKQGSCYYGKCTLAADGSRMDDASAEAAVCRANPEVDSPFGNEVVERWIDADELLQTDANPTNPQPSSSSNVRSLPYDMKSGFEYANLCAPGEDCACTYKKISTSVGVKTYIDAETDLSDLAKDELLGGDAGGRLGICSGGDADGALCTVDKDCNGIDTQDDKELQVALGKCYPIVREDTIVGLDGFCLERDTGININGDPNTGACLTWFPVDQLAGATDLFAKYKEAGYFAGNTEYCVDVRPFVNIRPSNADAPDASATDWRNLASIACAEQENNTCFTDEFHCPPNHYAVMSTWYNGGREDTFAISCDRGVDNDCPFVCVPNNAADLDGNSCLEEIVKASTGYSETSSKLWEDIGVNGENVSWTTDVYYYGSSYKKFDNVAIELQNCVADGIEVDQNLATDTIGNNGQKKTYTAGMVEEYIRGGVSGWYDYHQTETSYYYVGCKKNVIVDDDSGESAPYTDRLLNPTANYMIPHNEISISSIGYTPNFDYRNNTTSGPFGISIPAVEIDGAKDPNPSVVMSCRALEDADQMLASPDRNDVCIVGNPITEDAPEARGFVDFFLRVIALHGGGLKYEWELKSVFGAPGVSTAFLGVTETIPAIEKLFARNFGGWEFLDGADSDGMGSMDTLIEGGSSDEIWSWDRRSLGNPPTVWSIDPQHCYGAYCQEGEENELTINSQNGGDHEGDGGFFRTTMQFFAAADKNQLPLRRIIVDWGDGKQDGSESADNYYKNHRGLEEDSQTTSICERCDDGGSDCDWGMTINSCDPNYFTYQHNYRCTKSDVYNLPRCDFTSGDLMEACSDGAACYYQPKVHVRDNWGWCTGECTYIGDDGCFDSLGSLEQMPELSECNYNSHPSSLTDPRDPWVYYSGLIRVEP